MPEPAVNHVILEQALSPDPRILPMLGEINLAQWRCLAELIDNSVDGFLSVLRAGGRIENTEVFIDVPTTEDASSRVKVSDNGPGMTPDRLEKAVRAGWSGNNPIESLGMFGMGFNISTARLGTVTTVWTSQTGESEEHGLRIDFQELRAQGHFRTPRLTRPKSDPSTSGTSIVVERLKPEQRAWFAKPGNRTRAKKELARAYSTMLRENGVPISFKLIFQGSHVRPIEHCVWNEDRSVETPRSGTVFAVQRIDRKLPDRPFCTNCWQWLTVSDMVCPACRVADNVVQRKRHVHGWIGIQRFLSATNYGIDLIRNGRKIEIGSRDLFIWRDPNSETEEIEYPIDDPRQRGRFVGEIHLDHCRVTYMKDRFDRTDPAWDEMVIIARGEGPLQPQKAANLGYSGNQSSLFKLYQAFRRSSPPNARVAGGWKNVLAVKDNDRAEEMVKKFHESMPEYATDQRWWDLVEEEDNRLLTLGGGGASDTGTAAAGIPGFSGGGSGTDKGAEAATAPPPPPRTPIASLTREYLHDDTGLRFDVVAFAVQPNDPGLGGVDRPWASRKLPQGDTEVLLSIDHPIFRSATMTDLDALLCELAFKAADFTRGQAGALPFSRILADFRDRYAGSRRLDPVSMSTSAEMLFRAIARAWPEDIDADDAGELFNGLPTDAQETVHHKMAARAVPNPLQVISSGRFLEYAPPKIVVDFVLAHPDLFFDGNCWEDSYSGLDYLHPSATEEARNRLLQYYEALLLDALWLSEMDPDDMSIVPRERLLRAMLAIDLLAPTEPSDDA